MNRDKTIIQTSLIGIMTNVALAGFKAFVGILSNSIAIVLDAVNNLSDALSSLITIVATKLAGKEPDKNHPYGYGRIEYLSAMIISVIILYAGVTSLVESIKKIVTPELPDYSKTTLIIVAVGVVVKWFLGRYVKSVGEKVNSDSLVNSGEDARLDAIISASTLVAALIFLWKGISLEAYLGVIISIFIIKAGLEMLQETLNRILGERAESDLSKEIKRVVCSCDGALGAYDLVLHDYGPDRKIASVHVEVPDTLNATEIDELTRNIQEKVASELDVILSAISIYAYNTKDDEAAHIRDDIKSLVTSMDGVLQMHGFYVDIEKKTMRFDVVISFDVSDRKALYQTIVESVQKKYPEYQIMITLDTDTSD